MTSENFEGLSDEEVETNRKKYGANTTEVETKNKFWRIAFEIISEPLFVVLVFAALVYFILGQFNEGIVMLVAIFFVSGISLYQENKSRNAVESLKKLSSPSAKVVRNGKTTAIPTETIVLNDLIVVEDGDIIPADAKIVEAHDFSVNESILTGESLPVDKNMHEPNNTVFQGTMVMAGSCMARVTAVGKTTALGKIGQSLTEIEITKTPLQLQIKSFVRSMIGVGFIAFIIVWGINYYLSKSILHGLLHGLTLVMSIFPEEIPVAFSTFMALGAYHLYQKKVIVKSPYTVETLGAATIICTDKTGTITENAMRISAIFEASNSKTYDYTTEPISFNSVLEYAMWSSETQPFDNMEKSIHEAYSSTVAEDKRPSYKLIHEYPLAGKPPIMTHVFSNDTKHIIACKGSVEGVLKQSNLSDEQKTEIQNKTKALASKGFRVLAVAKSDNNLNDLPASQQQFEFTFIGLIAFYDPPKKNIADTIQQFYNAGIQVKMITGDYPETAIAIANQIHLKNSTLFLTGNEVLAMKEEELREKIKTINIYARMFPDAKLKVIEALKANNEIIAMTGDGVNDGPALKAAHIGIAMGLRGSEIAKNASAIILADDDFSHMVDAVALGRRIYENLKKAIQYIISIHIPIILIVTLPLLLFWNFTEFFSPIHVIFLELIMGPTCSIIFENEPIEKNSMLSPPRKINTSFFSFHELTLSIFQGLAITLGCLGLGYFFMLNNHSEAEVRTVIYSTLICSNIFLTLVNRSFYYSILTTIKYKNNLIPIILITSLLILLLSIYLPPVRNLFQFAALELKHLMLCVFIAFISVIWVEIYKLLKRRG